MRIVFQMILSLLLAVQRPDKTWKCASKQKWLLLMLRYNGVKMKKRFRLSQELVLLLYSLLPITQFSCNIVQVKRIVLEYKHNFEIRT